MFHVHKVLLALLLSSCTTTIQPVELHMDCMIITGRGTTPDYGSVTWTKIMCPFDEVEEEDETETDPVEGAKL